MGKRRAQFELSLAHREYGSDAKFGFLIVGIDSI